MKHASRAIALSVVIACTLGTMAVGVAAKSPCASGDWSGDPQYRYWCYSDIVPLIATEQLEGARLPFLDACAPSTHNCDEYPVLSMYVMRAAAWVANLAPGDGPRYAPFFYVNAAILAAAAVAVAICLWALIGRRALWFALSPTLLLTGTVNWDLVAVALATGALVAYAARREEWSGVAIGLGAATKFYPAFLVVPLFVQGLRDRQPDRSVRVLWWSVGAWLAVNIPFAIAAPRGWIEFFRFNSERAADFDSLWYIAADLWPRAALPIRVVNVASIALFAVGVAICWWAKARVPGRLQPWTLAFPLVVVFLLVNKVYSPQYGLWLRAAVRALRAELPRLRAVPGGRCGGLPHQVPLLRRLRRAAVGLARVVVPDRAPRADRGARARARRLDPQHRPAAAPAGAPDRGRRGAGHGDGAGGRAGVTSPRLRDGVRDALVVFVIVRVLLFAISSFSVELLPLPPNQPTSVPGWPAPVPTWSWTAPFTATERQDALWFLRIATDGYRTDDNSAAFFPLYPLAIRAVALLPGVGPLGAALLVSNAALFGALVVLHALTRLELGDAHARRSLLLVALFPTACFLLAPYTESLFLLLSLLAFWYARRDRWALAALAGAGAALTRSVGLVLILALWVEAVRQWRREDRAPIPRFAAAAAVARRPAPVLRVVGGRARRRLRTARRATELAP